jgi:hypothetical protein
MEVVSCWRGARPGGQKRHSPTLARRTRIDVRVGRIDVCHGGADGLAPVQKYRIGDIQYFESARSFWKDSGQAEAHVVLVSFR